jgi:hypothetical protein
LTSPSVEIRLADGLGSELDAVVADELALVELGLPAQLAQRESKPNARSDRFNEAFMR